MKHAVFLSALIVLVAGLPVHTDLYEGYEFSHFVADFGRQYQEHEVTTRKEIFEANLAKIRAINSDPTSSWKAGINDFTDLTVQEFKQRIRGYDKALGRHLRSTRPASPQPVLAKQVPAELDWRTKGNVVTPVKNQAACGSCWAFSAVETIESAWAIKTGKLIVMSEQNVLDCTANPRHCGGTGGCGGATQELAYDAMKDKGIVSEAQYPYQSGGGRNFQCRFDATKMEVVANVTGHVTLAKNKYDVLIAAVQNGPVALTVAAGSWQMYRSGVFTGCRDWDLDHGVQLVGYGTDPVHGGYYIVRNSWGASWGEKGYIRIQRLASEEGHCGTDTNTPDGTACDGDPKTDNVCGTCGILYDNSYPTLG